MIREIESLSRKNAERILKCIDMGKCSLKYYHVDENSFKKSIQFTSKSIKWKNKIDEQFYAKGWCTSENIREKISELRKDVEKWVRSHYLDNVPRIYDIQRRPSYDEDGMRISGYSYRIIFHLTLKKEYR